MQIFSRSLNKLPVIAGAASVVAVVAVIGMIWYYFSPWYTQVGYQPKHCLDQKDCPEGQQPVPYSHQLHAGQLGMDCRYCHVNVERSAIAMVPPVQTCMNCHKVVKPESAKLAPIRESWETGKPIEWVRIHKLPDHAYFDHSVHVTAGVGCIECHGRIDQMKEVRQQKPLSMGWCLECHRDVRSRSKEDQGNSPYLRPVAEITNMEWTRTADTKFAPPRHLNPPENCSGCHR